MTDPLIWRQLTVPESAPEAPAPPAVEHSRRSADERRASDDSASTTARSESATASLVLGLMWICGLGSLAAIVFGIIGVRATRGRRRRGRGVAIAGLVVGVAGLSVAVGSAIAIWSAADETVITQADERDDVRLVSCQRTADGFGQVELEVTNDTSRASSYLLTISFRTSADELPSDLVSVDAVMPDETRFVTVRSIGPLTDASEPACGVAFVQRFSDG